MQDEAFSIAGLSCEISCITTTNRYLGSGPLFHKTLESGDDKAILLNEAPFRLRLGRLFPFYCHLYRRDKVLLFKRENNALFRLIRNTANQFLRIVDVILQFTTCSFYGVKQLRFCRMTQKRTLDYFPYALFDRPKRFSSISHSLRKNFFQFELDYLGKN